MQLVFSWHHKTKHVSNQSADFYGLQLEVCHHQLAILLQRRRHRLKYLGWEKKSPNFCIRSRMLGWRRTGKEVACYSYL